MDGRQTGYVGDRLAYTAALNRTCKALLLWCACAGEELRCGMLHGMTYSALLHVISLPHPCEYALISDFAAIIQNNFV